MAFKCGPAPNLRYCERPPFVLYSSCRDSVLQPEGLAPCSSRTVSERWYNSPLGSTSDNTMSLSLSSACMRTARLLTWPYLIQQILALSDPNAKWSAQLGLSQDLSAVDFGTRTKRYALIIDDLKVTYVGVCHPYPPLHVRRPFKHLKLSRFLCQVETERGVTVSGADAVIAAL